VCVLICSKLHAYLRHSSDINNVGSIVQALLAAGNPSWDPKDGVERQAAQVSIISVANSAGRLLIGTSLPFCPL
jgi:hypothetical protein